MTTSYLPRGYSSALTEVRGEPDDDARGISEELIAGVVAEFYRRARRDVRLGPVFEAHVGDWSAHLSRMNDFWSAALLRTGRYSGRPVERHREVGGLDVGHFDRWMALFEETVRDLCPPEAVSAFVVRARRMREAMPRALGLEGR